MPTTITGLPGELTTLADDDLLVVDDTSEVETKKITAANLRASMQTGALALATTGTPADLGRSASRGVGTTAARADHVHDGSRVTEATMTASGALPDADVVYIDTSSGPIDVQLPSVVTGEPMFSALKKISTDTNEITLLIADDEEIEGVAADFVLYDSDSDEMPSWTLIRNAAGNYRVL